MGEIVPLNTVVMGIGNILLGDDGIGIHAVRALMNARLPQHVALLDVGMAFFDVLHLMEHTERIIILDAMQASGLPGTIYRSELHDCRAGERIDSLHNFDVVRMLSLAQKPTTCSITVFGVEPGNISWGMELSPNVSAALPFLLKAVCDEIGLNTIFDANSRRFGI